MCNAQLLGGRYEGPDFGLPAVAQVGNWDAGADFDISPARWAQGLIEHSASIEANIALIARHSAHVPKCITINDANERTARAFGDPVVKSLAHRRAYNDDLS